MSLDLIRTKHSWLTKGILLFLAVTFVLGFGFSLSNFGDLSGPSGGSAADVNGEKIPMSEFYRYRDNFRRQNPQLGELSPAALEQVNIRVLSVMIDEKLLSQKARELGFRVSDQEIDEFIKSIPAFQIDGQFIGTKGYEERIREIFNISPGEFENILREELLAAKMERFIYETALITEEELYNIYLRQNEKVNLYYIPFSSKDFVDAYTPGKEDVKKYYEANKDKFKTDELRSVRFITISPEDFENRIEISEEEVNAYYNAYPEEFVTEEGETLPLEEAREQILSTLKAQRGGVLREQFIEVMGNTENSEKTLDQLAAENKIETINESEMFTDSDILKEIPPRITRMAFEINKGETAIVPTGNSVWVFEVKEVVPSRGKKIEEAKEDIITVLKVEKAKQTAGQKARETLTQLKTVKKKDLGDKTKSLGVELKETGYFTRLDSVPVINNEQLRSEAFEIDEKTVVSNKLYNVKDDFYIVSIKEKESADKEMFEQQKNELKEQELSRQQRTLRRDWLQNLRRESEISPNASLFPTQG
jgi:peptidyl-prolyl cis-trans isomerase D